MRRTSGFSQALTVANPPRVTGRIAASRLLIAPQHLAELLRMAVPLERDRRRIHWLGHHYAPGGNGPRVVAADANVGACGFVTRLGSVHLSLGGRVEVCVGEAANGTHESKGDPVPGVPIVWPS